MSKVCSFKDVTVGVPFYHLRNGFVYAKVHPENLIFGDIKIEVNVLSIADGIPCFLKDNEEVLQITELVLIGDHIWIPVYRACDGGFGPLEINFVYHRRVRIIQIVPDKFHFANRAKVSGVRMKDWKFTSVVLPKKKRRASIVKSFNLE